MSYLVLARKYRPQDFNQVVGQASVVRILRNAISRDRVAHAMLFSGVRGVGKTTLARIMAKALNCEKQEGELPCNACPSCLEITAGTALDLHEIDGASNRGIQEIRDLKENIRFLPSRSRHKIMIIDEVHMLTNEAFNALLKTLEEPPAHVIFMFATTELHKIPVTILSRCQRYELKRVPFADLFGFFRKIAEAEEVKISDGALEMIAREAAGSVRDGLSLLDQVFSFGGEEMTGDDVREVLGLVGSQVYEHLGEALLAEDLGTALEILEEVCAAGADLKRFSADLLLFVRGLVVCGVARVPGALIEGSDREIAAMADLAGRHTAETIYNLFDRLLKGAAEMQRAPDPRLVLEMTFARIVQSGQVVPVSSLLARIDELLAAGSTERATVTGAPLTGVTEKKKSESVAERESNPVRVSEAAASFRADPAAVEPDPPVFSENPAPEPESPPAPVKDARKDWDEFVAYVRERKAWMAPVLKMCTPPRLQGAELQMKYDDITECRILQQSDNLKNLTEFAQDFFQKELRIKIIARSGGEAAPGDEPDAPQEERIALRRDPLAQMVAEIFNGHVGDVRTGPRSRVVKTEMDEEK